MQRTKVGVESPAEQCDGVHAIRGFSGRSLGDGRVLYQLKIPGIPGEPEQQLSELVDRLALPWRGIRDLDSEVEPPRKGARPAGEPIDEVCPTGDANQIDRLRRDGAQMSRPRTFASIQPRSIRSRTSASLPSRVPLVI